MEYDDIYNRLIDYVSSMIDMSIRFHPIYLLPFFLISIVIYVYYRFKKDTKLNYIAWMFPKEVYYNKSFLVDIQLFIVTRIFALSGLKLLNVIAIQLFFAAIAILVITGESALVYSSEPIDLMNLLIVTLIITVTLDFCTYITHRIHHESPVLWPFHSVHHSAEHLNPFTVYRKHPIYDFIFSIIKSCLVGIVMGAIIAITSYKISIYEILGANFIYFAFNFIGSNFRHTHIWISYGRILEHIFISPAQHQIHHSLKPKHINKNYGEIFAIWDWMFGTLYIPKEKEDLKFGISKSINANELIKQPHPTLKDALIVPFKDSWKIIKRKKSTIEYES